MKLVQVATPQMKAVSYHKYGSSEVIQFEKIPKPIPKDNEVLIRIHETIVTPSDIATRKGDPWIIRLFSGFFRPKNIPGTDFAGEIEAVGKAVTKFKKGDRVFGSTGVSEGAHAEYKCLPEDGVLETLPPSFNYESVAGICDAAMTALSFLKEEANIQSGQKILINGASGAVGTFAIQLAKYFGAEVTGVCSAANTELVFSLGANKVIDYTKEDFTQSGETWDIIFDAVGKNTFSNCKKALTQNGVYLTTVPTFGIIFQMVKTSLFGTKKAKFAATGLNQTLEKLKFLKDLIGKEKLRSVVDSHFPFEQIAEAHKFVETGRKRGNLVISLS